MTARKPTPDPAAGFAPVDPARGARAYPPGAGRPLPDAPGVKPDPGGAQAPVTAGPDGTPASGPPVVTGLSGAEWRKQAKAATSALHATQRRRATRYVRKADRGAGAQYRPGMGRRMPPGPPESDGAA